MTGFEYCAATGMLYEGMDDDALKCIGAIRERFDGARRNPFDEPECGHHYARSMASWSAVLALSGFHYSGVDRRMEIAGKPGKWFWSNGSAWGTVTVSDGKAVIEVNEGRLEIDSFVCGGKTFKKKIKIGSGEGAEIKLI